MRLRNWLGSSIVVAGLTAGMWLAAPAVAQQQGSDASQQQTGDSVADAARKAREQQKATPKPKKVYTDDDVKPLKTDASNASAVSGSSESQGAANNQAAAANGTDAAGSKDDPATVWKKKFADQRAKIATAEKELDLLQKEEQKAEVQYYPDPQKALTEQYTRKDVNDKLTKIDAKKQEIANLKQQLSDMEDDLRKSGGDPGWAR